MDVGYPRKMRGKISLVSYYNVKQEWRERTAYK